MTAGASRAESALSAPPQGFMFCSETGQEGMTKEASESDIAVQRNSSGRSGATATSVVRVFRVAIPGASDVWGASESMAWMTLSL